MLAFPMLIIGGICLSQWRRSVKPSGASGRSSADGSVSMSGNQNRMRNSRAISIRRRPNCKRCVLT